MPKNGLGALFDLEIKSSEDALGSNCEVNLTLRPDQAAKDYATLKTELDEVFGENKKKILTLSGNWEYYFMRQFSRLNNDWYGMAWHWYPLGAGSSDDVIPNINNPDFTVGKPNFFMINSEHTIYSG